MTYRSWTLHVGLGLSLSLSLSACGDDSMSSSEGSTGEPTSEASTDASTGTDSGTDTSTGSTATTGTDSDTGTTTTTTTDATSTTGDPACELIAVACAAAEQGGAFLDCGVVDPWNNSAEEWQTARDCALDAASQQKAFKLVTWLAGIDSQVGLAYVGFEGETYGITRYYYDSYPPELVTQASCGSLSPTMGCTDGPDQEACLTCDDQTEPVTICGGE